MDVEAALLLDSELGALDETWDNYVLAGFRMAHIIQDRLDPAEAPPLQRLAAVLLELLEGSGLPRPGADERVIKAAIEALSAEVRAVLEHEPGPSPAFRSGCWVVFENAPNGTQLLRGIFTSPGRAQKGLEHFTGLLLPRHRSRVPSEPLRGRAEPRRSTAPLTRMAKFDFPVPKLPPELLEKVIAAGKILQRRRAAADIADVPRAVDSVGETPPCVTDGPMPAHHSRIDPTPAGALLSLSELLATVVEARPFPDGPEGTFELLDASGTRLGTTTEETAQRLWPSKLYDHGSPEHVEISAAVDAALSSGDPDELAAATQKLKLVRPPKS